MRLADHRALTAAIATGRPLILVYVHDEETAGPWRAGGACRWWLAKSLEALSRDIERRGGRLLLRRGRAVNVIAELTGRTNAEAVYVTRRYEPWAVEEEKSLLAEAQAQGFAVKRYGGHLLREPEELRTKSGEPYKVYTPFWRAFAFGFTPAKALSPPKAIPNFAAALPSDTLDDWGLLPSRPDWAAGLRAEWTPGEAGAKRRLKAFLDTALAPYAEARDRPDRHGTSRLSPHLAFGEISPAAIWRAATDAAAETPGIDRSRETFLKEMVWREFSYGLLVHWPDLPNAPFRKDFAAFPWRESSMHLRAWQRGETGYPIVDAGMRELWATGYMHNRVRMIAASFLVKHLLIPWQSGAKWFFDTLVDADLANNSASWQWIAGSGADAAPYFRIFNPQTQGEKFDSDGVYVRRWVPELSKLSADHIHAPWTASADVLARAGVVLGKTYPAPIVDHAAARARALAAYGQRNFPADHKPIA